MRHTRTAVLAVSAVLTVSACSSSGSHGVASSGSTTGVTPTTAAASPVVRQAAIATLGSVLVDANGMTLYHNVHEAGGAIVCTASCVSVWPPLSIASGAPPPTAGAGVTGVLGTVTRPDGVAQVTYNGLPLYRYAKDLRPGDANGQGVANVWFVVTTATTAAAAPATAGATTTTTVRPAPSAPAATAPRVPATAPPTTAASKPPPTSPPSTSPPKTSPPTTTPVTQPCAYPPCY